MKIRLFFHFASLFTILFLKVQQKYWVNLRGEYLNEINERLLLTDTISQKSKRQKLLSTGDAQDTVHTNAACSPSQQEMNSYQQKMNRATMLDLGKLRQTRSCIKWKEQEIVPVILLFPSPPPPILGYPV